MLVFSTPNAVCYFILFSSMASLINIINRVDRPPSVSIATLIVFLCAFWRELSAAFCDIATRDSTSPLASRRDVMRGGASEGLRAPKDFTRLTFADNPDSFVYSVRIDGVLQPSACIAKVTSLFLSASVYVVTFVAPPLSWWSNVVLRSFRAANNAASNCFGFRNHGYPMVLHEVVCVSETFWHDTSTSIFHLGGDFFGYSYYNGV